MSDRDKTFSQSTELSNEKIKKDRAGLLEFAPSVFVICFIVCIFASAMAVYRLGYVDQSFTEEMEELRQVKDDTADNETDDAEISDGDTADLPDNKGQQEQSQSAGRSEMLYEMAQLYAQNSDLIGWLYIEDTNVDYPVMQTPADEEYYLDKDFQKNYSSNGCLIMDTDSVVGSGTKAEQYTDGTTPGTNLIIHGHNMNNGDMFGNLDKYRDSAYEEEHSIIKFTSLYEEREYEIVSVFLSQVYKKTQTDVFKYYQFFQADTQTEFDDFYQNIKDAALYDTGVEAEFGDEFITLSVCAYHVENGRLVVVAKRIQ